MSETSSRDESEIDREEAWAQVRTVVQDCRLPILTTVGADAVPHATWMSTVTSGDLDEVLTITSPDSEKVGNIRDTGQAEWMFTSASKDYVVYLSGATEVVEDVAEIKRCWEVIPEKAHAFFLGYYNSGMGFAILRTRVEKIVLCEPKRFRKLCLRPADSA